MYRVFIKNCPEDKNRFFCLVNSCVKYVFGRLAEGRTENLLVEVAAWVFIFENNCTDHYSISRIILFEVYLPYETVCPSVGLLVGLIVSQLVGRLVGQSIGLSKFPKRAGS